MRIRTGAAFLAAGLLVASTAAADENELGKKLYAQKCASCHGADGRGNAQMAKMLKVTIPDLTASPGKSDEELVKVIAEGKKPMPAFKLSKEELDGLLAFVKSIGASR